MPGYTIRPERAADRAAIRELNDAAFGQTSEGELVDALRRGSTFIPELSLVAADSAGAIIGHILLTRISVGDGATVHPALALAPMAVLPAHQRRGVGSALVGRGLADARELGHSVVIVLGHSDYYPRFGFRPAARFGIRSPFEAPDEAFMVLSLRPGALDSVSGLVEYPPEFHRP